MHPACFFNFIVEKLSQLSCKSITSFEFLSIFGPINNVFYSTRLFFVLIQQKRIFLGAVIFSLQAKTV